MEDVVVAELWAEEVDGVNVDEDERALPHGGASTRRDGDRHFQDIDFRTAQWRAIFFRYIESVKRILVISAYALTLPEVGVRVQWLLTRGRWVLIWANRADLSNPIFATLQVGVEGSHLLVRTPHGVNHQKLLFIDMRVVLDGTWCVSCWRELLASGATDARYPTGSASLSRNANRWAHD